MKKFFSFCLIATWALAVTACSDKKEDPPGTEGSITVNGRTEMVGSGFCDYGRADGYDQKCWTILLCNEALDKMPASEPDFYICVSIPETHMGKIIILTDPLEAKSWPKPCVSIAVPGRLMQVDDRRTTVFDLPDNDRIPTGVALSEGMVEMTRDGMEFTLKLNMRFSDGNTAAANWRGKIARFDTEK